MFFSMGVLQIVIEALAILLTLLLITFASAFFYFCCYKLQNVRAAKKDKVLSLAEQGWEYETDKPTVFFVENERQLLRGKESENMKILQKKSDKLNKLMENLKILQKKRDLLRKLNSRSKNVYIVQKTGDPQGEKSKSSSEGENEKPGEVSPTTYSKNTYENEREVLFDPRFAIPLWKYQELIEQCRI